MQSDGDGCCARCSRSPELNATLASGNRKFKDPMQFVASSLRLAYDGRMVANLSLANGWLNQLGEPPCAASRRTVSSAAESAGQLGADGQALRDCLRDRFRAGWSFLHG
ncbi:hypothetical protein ACU4GD_12270 [Cupriavidus basilensis]